MLQNEICDETEVCCCGIGQTRIIIDFAARQHPPPATTSGVLRTYKNVAVCSFFLNAT
jgi:hypothetical protein